MSGGGILHVVGARPNFMKLAPIHRALMRVGAEQAILHTGQHYDEGMSDRFFRELELPAPDVDLGVGSGSHAEQTAAVMTRIEPHLTAREPTWIVVYGDVNSTVAATLVAAKLGLRVAHVEAGLRSGDRTMPEEINRIVTDRLADLLLTPSRDADRNLLEEGVNPDAIFFVGNVMIDTLLHTLKRTAGLSVEDELGEPLSDYVLVTLHRPSNVDSDERLNAVLDALDHLADDVPVVFPVHPRTAARIASLGRKPGPGARWIEPVGYRGMVTLMASARAILTDSGGIQEESSVLGVPCVTLRPNTERPITIDRGTNRLENDPWRAIEMLREPGDVTPMEIEGWDGAAGERVAAALVTR